MTVFRHEHPGKRRRVQKDLRVPAATEEALIEALAALTAVGLSLEASFGAMAAQEMRTREKHWQAHIRGAVARGVPLAEVLRASTEVIPLPVLALIDAGERSGELPAMLTRACALLQLRRERKREWGSALIYPGIVLAAVIAVSAILLLVVLPGFEASLLEFNGSASLPLLTRLLFAASATLREHGWTLLAGTCSPPLLLIALPRHVRARVRACRGVLGWMPLFRRARNLAALSDFSHVLGGLLRAGTPMVDALRLASHALTHEQHAKAAQRAADRISAGEPVADCLLALPFTRFPMCRVLAFVTLGRRPEVVFHALAQAADEALRVVHKRLMSVAEPALVLALALLVALVLAAVFFPLLALVRDFGMT